MYVSEYVAEKSGGGTGKGTAKKIFPLPEPSLDQIQSTTSTRG